MLHKYLTLGGVTTYLDILAGLLTNKGYCVHLIAGVDEKNRALMESLESSGLNLIPVPNSRNIGAMSKNILKEILRLRRNKRVDIIHSHHRLTHLLGKFVSTVSPIPLLLTVHEFKNDQEFLTRIWKNERMTVPSHALKQHLMTQYSVKDKKIKVIPNALKNKISLDGKKLEWLRQNVFNTADVIYVGYIGRVCYEKGLDTIIESMQLVRRADANIKFRIFGDGPLLEDLKIECEKMGFNPDEVFQGVTHHVNEVLELLDIFLAPSRNESFCISAVEALRASRPVIAGRVGGLTEVIKDETTGFLIEPGNARKLADKILLLSSKKQLRLKLGQQGRQRFEEKFTLPSFYKNYVRQYDQLVKQNP